MCKRNKGIRRLLRQDCTSSLVELHGLLHVSPVLALLSSRPLCPSHQPTSRLQCRGNKQQAIKLREPGTSQVVHWQPWRICWLPPRHNRIQLCIEDMHTEHAPQHPGLAVHRQLRLTTKPVHRNVRALTSSLNS
jgi:hypothetical protein